MKSLVLYGGSFDPVHKAHIATIDAVLAELPGAVVKVLPCRIPAHKDALHASAAQRLEMLALTFKSHSQVDIDQRELNREGVSYTVDTLAELRRESEGPLSLIFVMGWDSWLNFSSWHRYWDILDLANLLVLRRPGVSQQPGLESDHRRLERYRDIHHCSPRQLGDYPFGKIALLENPEWPVASHTIRRLRAEGIEDWRDQVHEEVARFIEGEGLYQ